MIQLNFPNALTIAISGLLFYFVIAVGAQLWHSYGATAGGAG